MANHNITMTFAVGTAKIDGTASNATTVATSVADGAHTLSIQKYVTVAGITYVCTGWASGSGDIASTGTANTVTITLSQTSAMTWAFKYLTKCPSCGEGFGADTAAMIKRKIIAVSETKAVCVVCGYDDSGNPAFTQT